MHCRNSRSLAPAELAGRNLVSRSERNFESRSIRRNRSRLPRVSAFERRRLCAPTYRPMVALRFIRLLLAACAIVSANAQADDVAFFTEKIQPILEERCFEC